MITLLNSSKAETQINSGLVSVSPPSGFWKGTKYTLKSLSNQKQLISLLVRREIKTRYKDSFLGVIWSLIRPLVQLLIFYIAIGKFLGAERSIPEFAIFVFAGLTVWTLFSEVLTFSTSSILGNAGLIKKVYLPREIFPIAASLTALFNFFVQFFILLSATLFLNQAPLHLDFLMVPVSVLLLFSFAFAWGLLLSAVNVYFRDIEHLVQVLLLVLFWASPIVYSYDFVNKALAGSIFEQIYLWNPITVGVMQFQKGMWMAGQNQLWPHDLESRTWLLLLLSVMLIWFSQRIFARLQGNFAQEL